MLYERSHTINTQIVVTDFLSNTSTGKNRGDSL